VISFFFVKDGTVMSGWVLDQLQPSTAATARAIGERSWTTLTGYVRGTAINGLVNAVLMSIGLVLLHVPLVPVIAVLTFFGGFFPIVGAFASGAVAAAVALVAKGPGTALLVVGLTIVVHHVEGYLVGPIVLGRAVRLHTIVVLLALAAGGEIAGVLGAFVAVPLTAVTVGIVDELRHGETARASGAAAVAAATAPAATPVAPAPQAAPPAPPAPAATPREAHDGMPAAEPTPRPGLPSPAGREPVLIVPAPPSPGRSGPDRPHSRRTATSRGNGPRRFSTGRQDGAETAEDGTIRCRSASGEGGCPRRPRRCSTCGLPGGRARSTRSDP